MGMGRKTIFWVDDDVTNLTIGKNTLAEFYNVFTLNSGERLLKMLEKLIPDVILLDVEMPEMSGYEVIRTIKDNRETAHIPIIFLTAKSEHESELEGLSLGAVDYIAKPFAPSLLRKRVELHLRLEEQKLVLERQKGELQHYNDNLQSMVEEKTRTILKLQYKLLGAMSEIVEGRDGVTGDHIARVREYLRIFLCAVVNAGLWADEAAGWDIELLCQSCQLHDVGKIAISDSILKAPRGLTAEEFAVMQQHVAFGVNFIERLEEDDEGSIAFLRYAKIFVKYHHERWDGTGYPAGLAGEEIPLLGRLMGIVDVYDALTSDRPYKKAYSHADAVRTILDGKGRLYDPVLVDLFLGIAAEFAAVATLHGHSGQGAP